MRRKSLSEVAIIVIGRRLEDLMHDVSKSVHGFPSDGTTGHQERGIEYA